MASFWSKLKVSILLQSDTKDGQHIVNLTPLSFVPGAKIDKYLGSLNFFLIRETSSLREVTFPALTSASHGRDYFFISPFYPLYSSWSLSRSFPRRLASSWELGSQVGSTTDHSTQHTEDLSAMRASAMDEIFRDCAPLSLGQSRLRTFKILYLKKLD